VTNSVFAEPPWYGPVCRVVWEGGAARLLPIPMRHDILGFSSAHLWAKERHIPLLTELPRISSIANDKPCASTRLKKERSVRFDPGRSKRHKEIGSFPALASKKCPNSRHGRPACESPARCAWFDQAGTLLTKLALRGAFGPCMINETRGLCRNAHVRRSFVAKKLKFT
jgi:hypothetical protein